MSSSSSTITSINSDDEEENNVHHQQQLHLEQNNNQHTTTAVINSDHFLHVEELHELETQARIHLRIAERVEFIRFLGGFDEDLSPIKKQQQDHTPNMKLLLQTSTVSNDKEDDEQQQNDEHAVMMNTRNTKRRLQFIPTAPSSISKKNNGDTLPNGRRPLSSSLLSNAVPPRWDEKKNNDIIKQDYSHCERVSNNNNSISGHQSTTPGSSGVVTTFCVDDDEEDGVKIINQKEETFTNENKNQNSKSPSIDVVMDTPTGRKSSNDEEVRIGSTPDTTVTSRDQNNNNHQSPTPSTTTATESSPKLLQPQQQQQNQKPQSSFSPKIEKENLVVVMNHNNNDDTSSSAFFSRAIKKMFQFDGLHLIAEGYVSLALKLLRPDPNGRQRILDPSFFVVVGSSNKKNNNHDNNNNNNNNNNLQNRLWRRCRLGVRNSSSYDQNNNNQLSNGDETIKMTTETFLILDKNQSTVQKLFSSSTNDNNDDEFGERRRFFPTIEDFFDLKSSKQDSSFTSEEENDSFHHYYRFEEDAVSTSLQIFFHHHHQKSENNSSSSLLVTADDENDTKDENLIGIYRVMLCEEGWWREIIIDEWLPTATEENDNNNNENEADFIKHHDDQEQRNDEAYLRLLLKRGEQQQQQKQLHQNLEKKKKQKRQFDDVNENFELIYKALVKMYMKNGITLEKRRSSNNNSNNNSNNIIININNNKNHQSSGISLSSSLLPPLPSASASASSSLYLHLLNNNKNLMMMNSSSVAATTTTTPLRFSSPKDCYLSACFDGEVHDFLEELTGGFFVRFDDILLESSSSSPSSSSKNSLSLQNVLHKLVNIDKRTVVMRTKFEVATFQKEKEGEVASYQQKNHQHVLIEEVTKAIIKVRSFNNNNNGSSSSSSSSSSCSGLETIQIDQIPKIFETMRVLITPECCRFENSSQNKNQDLYEKKDTHQAESSSTTEKEIRARGEFDSSSGLPSVAFLMNIFPPSMQQQQQHQKSRRKSSSSSSSSNSSSRISLSFGLSLETLNDITNLRPCTLRIFAEYRNEKNLESKRKNKKYHHHTGHDHDDDDDDNTATDDANEEINDDKDFSHFSLLATVTTRHNLFSHVNDDDDDDGKDDEKNDDIEEIGDDLLHDEDDDDNDKLSSSTSSSSSLANATTFLKARNIGIDRFDISGKEFTRILIVPLILENQQQQQHVKFNYVLRMNSFVHHHHYSTKLTAEKTRIKVQMIDLTKSQKTSLPPSDVVNDNNNNTNALNNALSTRDFLVDEFFCALTHRTVSEMDSPDRRQRRELDHHHLETLQHDLLGRMSFLMHPCFAIIQEKRKNKKENGQNIFILTTKITKYWPFGGVDENEEDEKNTKKKKNNENTTKDANIVSTQKQKQQQEEATRSFKFAKNDENNHLGLPSLQDCFDFTKNLLLSPSSSSPTDINQKNVALLEGAIALNKRERREYFDATKTTSNKKVPCCFVEAFRDFTSFSMMSQNQQQRQQRFSFSHNNDNNTSSSPKSEKSTSSFSFGDRYDFILDVVVSVIFRCEKLDPDWTKRFLKRIINTSNNYYDTDNNNSGMISSSHLRITFHSSSSSSSSSTSTSTSALSWWHEILIDSWLDVNDDDKIKYASIMLSSSETENTNSSSSLSLWPSYLQKGLIKSFGFSSYEEWFLSTTTNNHNEQNLMMIITSALEKVFGLDNANHHHHHHHQMPSTPIVINNNDIECWKINEITPRMTENILKVVTRNDRYFGICFVRPEFCSSSSSSSASCSSSSRCLFFKSLVEERGTHCFEFSAASSKMFTREEFAHLFTIISSKFAVRKKRGDSLSIMMNFLIAGDHSSLISFLSQISDPDSSILLIRNPSWKNSNNNQEEEKLSSSSISVKIQRTFPSPKSILSKWSNHLLRFSSSSTSSSSSLMIPIDVVIEMKFPNDDFFVENHYQKSNLSLFLKLWVLDQTCVGGRREITSVPVSFSHHHHGPPHDRKKDAGKSNVDDVDQEGMLVVRCRIKALLTKPITYLSLDNDENGSKKEKGRDLNFFHHFHHLDEKEIDDVNADDDDEEIRKSSSASTMPEKKKNNNVVLVATVKDLSQKDLNFLSSESPSSSFFKITCVRNREVNDDAVTSFQILGEKGLKTLCCDGVKITKQSFD